MPTILNPGNAYILVISIDFAPGSVGSTMGFDDFLVTPEPGDSPRLLLIVAIGTLLCAARFRSVALRYSHAMEGYPFVPVHKASPLAAPLLSLEIEVPAEL